MGASSNSVVLDDVVGVDDPEGARLNIRVEKTVGLPCEDSQVVLQDVVLLDSVLNEEGEPLDVEHDVVLNKQVVDSVDGAGTVKRLVDGVASDIRSRHIAVDVEVNRVPTNPEGLTNSVELGVTDPGSKKVFVDLLGMDEDDRTKLITSHLLAKLALEARLWRLLVGNERFLAGGNFSDKRLVHIALHLDVPGQQANLSSSLDESKFQGGTKNVKTK